MTIYSKCFAPILNIVLNIAIMAYIKRTPFSLSLLVLLFVGIGCTTVKYYPSNFVESLKHPTKFPDIFDFSVQNIEDVVEKNPLLEGEDVKITDVGENRNSSMHVLQLRENTEYSSHYHKRHDEVIYVKKGNAIAILDGTRYMVKSGSILQIPSKTVHKFVNTGDEAFMAISIFSPPFDGRDQKFTQKEKKTDRGAKEEKRLAGVTAKKIKEEVEVSSEEGTEKEIIEETEKVATAEEGMKEKAALPLSDVRDFQTKKEGTASYDYLTLKERGKKKAKNAESVEPPEVDIVSLHEKLTRLLKLKEEGIISADEYEKKKDALIMGGEKYTFAEPENLPKRDLPQKDAALLKKVDEYAQLPEDTYRLPNAPLDKHTDIEETYYKEEPYTQPGGEQRQGGEGYEGTSAIETLPTDHKLRLLHEMLSEGLISAEDFEIKKRELVLKTEEKTFPIPPPPGADREEKLSALKELYKEGLITEEDYRHKYNELSVKEESGSFAFDENPYNEKVSELEGLYNDRLITEEDYRFKYKEITGRDVFTSDIIDKDVNNEKLSELRELMEQGIITKEDYEAKKAQLTSN